MREVFLKAINEHVSIEVYGVDWQGDWDKTYIGWCINDKDGSCISFVTSHVSEVFKDGIYYDEAIMIQYQEALKWLEKNFKEKSNNFCIIEI